jgi:hypothetical protein
VDGEVDAGEHARQSQVAHLEHRVGEAPDLFGTLREDVLDRAPGHQADQLRGGGGARVEAGRDGPAVLEHRDAVADLPNLLETVGDVDHCHALARQLADDAEEVVDLSLVQNRRRLVEDEQPGVVGERTSHADDLLRSGRESADLPGRRDLAVSQPGEQLGGCTVGPAALAHPALGELVPEEDVLRDREARHQVELLVDRGDAQLHRRLRSGERDLVALPQDLALVRLVARGEHLDQRRLSGTVLSEEAVDLTRADVEVDTTQREDAREPLDDPPHLQQA